MRRNVLIVTSLLILVAFNYSIYQKEDTKANGETAFLMLGPVDPRSLMQGDYMRLNYAIQSTQVPQGQAESGYIVVDLDEKKVASFKRFHAGEALVTGEKLVRYHSQYGSVRIVPDSFMFQEGHAEIYQRARYGVFKFDAKGRQLLVGLADAELKEITPDRAAVPPAGVPVPAPTPAPAAVAPTPAPAASETPRQ